MKSSTIRHILLILCLLPVLSACQDDDLFRYGDDGLENGAAIEFDICLPEAGTRGIYEDDAVKTKFTDGDMIHIIGTFNTKYLTDDGNSYATGRVSRYGALQYSDKTNRWNAVAGSNLTWPSIATDGEFKAYYISGSNGVLTDATPSDTHSLSSVTLKSDPLQAQSEPDIEYGHAVKLNFSHICAYLTLEDLEPAVATEYWLYTEGPLDPETKVQMPFNNAYKITLVRDADGTPDLQFEFVQQIDPDYKNPDTGTEGLVYISAPAIASDKVDSEGNLQQTSRASFFLEPAFYEKFGLCYPALKPDVYKYVEYDYNTVANGSASGNTEVKVTPPDLKANTTYTLTITKSPGVTIIAPPDGGGWDDDGAYVTDIDVAEFLKAIYEGNSYTNNSGTLILDKTPEGTELLYNVDFGNYDYSQLPSGFLPNIQQGKVFEGNYHYIRNLADPLFRYNYGTIRNVGIKNINITADSYEDSAFDENSESDTGTDMSRYGALCMWNRGTGVIDNVKVEDVTMNITVISKLDVESDGSETHNIGCVLGSNTGRVNNMSLGGNFTLNVNGTDVNSSVLIGGLTGQNAAVANIRNVSPLDNSFTITIQNQCTGQFGSYSIGGVVGESTGYVNGVILSRLNINSANSQGVTSYIGGVAGTLSVSSGSTSSISSCIVSGACTAGITLPAGNISAESYIGGIAGSVQDVTVDDCRTGMSVTGAPTALEGVMYGTGGAFGRIRPSLKSPAAYNFTDLIAYGSLLKAAGNGTASNLTNYTGSFAGIAPAGQTWDYYSSNNIIIRSFPNLVPIGVSRSN